MTQFNHTFVHTPDGLKMIQRQTLVPKGEGNCYRPPQQPASPQRAGHHAGLHPEDAPYIIGNQRTHTGVPPTSRARRTQAPTYYDGVLPEEEDIDGDDYPTRMPTSTRRYNGDPEGRSRVVPGRRRIETHYHDEQYESQPEDTAPTYKRRFHVHWLLVVGIALMLMIAGWMAFSSFSMWWQVHQDDSTYGNPRTFQTDAVVGHADSSTSPSHFIAENLRGQIIIVEFPGGDASKARSYVVTTVPGNDSNPPVRLAFQDINRDGKLDMVILIGDPGSTVTIILFNNGSQFVSKL